MTKIIRTEAALRKYMNKKDGKAKFTGVELRKWWNPMRLIYGNIYYVIL